MTNPGTVHDAVDGSPELVVVAGPGFDAYVRRQGQALVRTAFLLTGDRHVAEDLVQVTLAKLAGRWARIEAGGDPHPYVRRSLVRTTIAWRRRRWHGEIPTETLPEGGWGVAAAERTSDRSEQLRAALARLPRRQRAVVVLRFYEDLSEAETARLLGCSVGTVKSQAAKARAHLRRLLDDDLPTHDPSSRDIPSRHPKDAP